MALGSYGGMSPDKSTGGGEYGGQSGGGENSGGIYDGLLSADGIANTGWQQTSGTEKDLGGTDNRDLDISPSLGETRLTEKTTIFNTAKLTGVDIEKVNALKNEGKTLVTSANGEVGYWGDSGYTSVVKGESVNTIASDTGIGAGSLRSLVDENGKPLSTAAANLVATKFREAYDSYIEKGMSVEAARARASYALGVGLSDGKSAPSRDNGLAYGERIGSSIMINSEGQTINTLNPEDPRLQIEKSLLPIEIAKMSEAEYEKFRNEVSLAYNNNAIDYQTYNKLRGTVALTKDDLTNIGITQEQYDSAISSYAVKNNIDWNSARFQVTGLFQAQNTHKTLMNTDKTYNALASTVGFVGNPVNLLKLTAAFITADTKKITDVFKGATGYDPYKDNYKVDDKTGAVTWTTQTAYTMNPNPTTSSVVEYSKGVDVSGTDNTTNTSSSTDTVGADTGAATPTATTAGQSSSFSLPFLAFEAPKGAFYRGERTGAQYVGSMDLTTGFKPPEVTAPTGATTAPTGASQPTVTAPTPTATTGVDTGGSGGGFAGMNTSSIIAANTPPVAPPVSTPTPVVTNPPPTGLMSPQAGSSPTPMTVEDIRNLAAVDPSMRYLSSKGEDELAIMAQQINSNPNSLAHFRNRELNYIR